MYTCVLFVSQVMDPENECKALFVYSTLEHKISDKITSQMKLSSKYNYGT